MAAARADVQAHQAQARFARAERIPSVTATGGIKRQSDGLHGAFIGLSVPFPIFDRNGGAVDAADAVVRGSQERLALTRRELQNDVLRATDAYAALRRRAALLTDDAIGDAADLLEIALVAYDAGDMELVELLDAAEALHQARTAEARLLAQLWIAHFDLERAVGGFEDAPSTEDGQ
jgi:cobalt-zinc-cadmium efflux system outer membrane protein